MEGLTAPLLAKLIDVCRLSQDMVKRTRVLKIRRVVRNVVSKPIKTLY
jgi:hypothetical protein